MINLTPAACADRTFRNGGREVIAWAGRRLRLAVRMVIRAVKMDRDEQVCPCGNASCSPVGRRR
jgi:hypothetical protein